MTHPNPRFAIRVRELGKQYRLPTAGARAEYHLVSEHLERMLKAPFRAWQHWTKRATVNARSEAHAFGEENHGSSNFWALRDVSFELQSGEAVAVIGCNGAGKSTLLKILSRITSPTRGEAILHGRVGSLLEVGTGFHPELTGRENIFLNGGILGMTRREIRRQFDAIVEFSGVERFLDLPVKRYSSGMRVRLAFAVAAHLEPEIIIVDEVLAVGDLAFQQKCMARMSEVASDGRTVLFVSHNMPAIEALCPRAILLEAGQVAMDGATPDVIQRYVAGLRINQERAGHADIDLRQHANRRPGSQPVLQRLRLLDATQRLANQLTLGEPLQFELQYVNPDQRQGLGFAVFVCSEQGQRLAMFHSRVHSQVLGSGQLSGRVNCHVPALPLLPGKYRVDVAVGTWNELLDYVEHAGTIQILPSDFLGTGELPNSRQGVMALHSTWQMVDETIESVSPSEDSSRLPQTVREGGNLFDAKFPGPAPLAAIPHGNSAIASRAQR